MGGVLMGEVLMSDVLMGEVLKGEVPKGKSWHFKYEPNFTSPLTSLQFQSYWDRDGVSVGIFQGQ